MFGRKKKPEESKPAQPEPPTPTIAPLEAPKPEPATTQTEQEKKQADAFKYYRENYQLVAPGDLVGLSYAHIEAEKLNLLWAIWKTLQEMQES